MIIEPAYLIEDVTTLNADTIRMVLDIGYFANDKIAISREFTNTDQGELFIATPSRGEFMYTSANPHVGITTDIPKGTMVYQIVPRWRFGPTPHYSRSPNP